MPFCFSHNPNLDYETSSFMKEIEHLKINGYKLSDAKNPEGFWFAYK